MSDTISAILAVATPLLTLVVPGVIFLKLHKDSTKIGLAARTVLWSIGLLTIGTLLGVTLSISPTVVGIIALLIGVSSLWFFRQAISKHAIHWYALLIATVFLALFASFSLPYLLFHQGLPTGDSQKAIIWSQRILATPKLPSYQIAVDTFNRDPVDFLTPGLHTLTALVMGLSPAPLLSIGFFAIAISLAIALVAVAIARLIAPRLPALPLIITTVFLVVSQLRFLRYLREPGYHFQNVVGELLLFGALFVTLALLKKWHRADVALLIVLLLALAVSHQFSTFITGFILLGPAVIFVVHRFRVGSKSALRQLIAPAIVVLALIGAGVALGLHSKITHIFTATPHLLSLTPDALDYVRLMGLVWVSLGLGGLLLLIRPASKHFIAKPEQWGFLAATMILLALSQAPRLNIDIPPVRALLYAVVPLSITGAYFVVTLAQRLRQLEPRSLRVSSLAILIAIVGVAGLTSLSQAFELSHSVRTNSTLTPGQLNIVRSLQNVPTTGGVLVDDFNRRSASWLILSQRPMYTRLASDLARQMAEARQSDLRYQLYLNQLDYEKIYSLASFPLITELMSKQNIEWITGITKASNRGFTYNPALAAPFGANDISLYTLTIPNESGCSLPLSDIDQRWLLRGSTIANDIGDDEDTFEHLPASIRSARLSEPLFDGSCTFRETRAPIIPLRFNIGDYVATLWDQDNNSLPDVGLELLVRTLQQPAELTLTTTAGRTLAVPTTTTLIQLDPTDATIDADGFITIMLNNPTNQPIALDLIALGLARTD